MDEAFQICDRIIIMNKGEKILEGNPHELVNANIEPFVLEVNSKDSFCRIRDRIGADTRVDQSTDLVRIYSKEQFILEGISKALDPGEYYLRQSNLEDLFLKITGSTLNALQ